MNDYISTKLDFYRSVFTEVENTIAKHKDVQIPALLATVGLQLKLEPKRLNELDAVIRDYVRNHPVYFISRGANGGVRVRAEQQAKQDAQAAKKAARAAAKDKIEAKVAAKVAAKVSTPKTTEEE
jgi:hypothetical protein